MVNGRILDEVTKTSIELLLKEAFYAHLLSSVNKEIVPDHSPVQTMAVGLRLETYVLFVNGLFWDNVLTDKRHRYGIIKHEILHLVFKHLLVREPGKDKHLLNVAMDIVVNQYIDRAQLPEKSVFLENFPELQLKRDQTYAYYYEKLKKLKDETDSNKGLPQSASAAFLRKIPESTYGLERHVEWGSFTELSSVEREILDAQIENLIRIAYRKTSTRQFDTLPLGVKIQIESVMIQKDSLVDWRTVLKLFAESSSKTYLKSTLKRPSRRYGTTPGIKVRRRQKFIIAIDTSGSIQLSEYEDFFQEIFYIWRQGCVVEVIECDTVIQHSFYYKGVSPRVIHGGGGTDFNAPIAYANNSRSCDALIYFTDGFAGAPELNCKVPVLWVICENGIQPGDEIFEKLIGRKARLQ